MTEILKEADAEYIFWDASELKRRTCMSWNFIQDQFFFDQGFLKEKSEVNGTFQQEKHVNFWKSG